MMFLAEFIKFREKNSFIYNDLNKQETSENEVITNNSNSKPYLILFVSLFRMME